jgi:acetyl-CoA carboxylase biotin carboxyl carrier protein
MTERNLSYEDLMQIVELVRTTSQFSEFRLKVGDVEVSLKRANGAVRPAPMPQETPVPEEAPATCRENRQVSFSENLHLVRSPMVGTFYRAPAPGQPPFVEVGQSVEPDSILCIVEVMKLMNSIEAGVRGTVRHIAVENAAAVEAGEVLLAIEPLS